MAEQGFVRRECDYCKIDLPQLSQESMLRAWYSEVFKHAVHIESKDYGREVVVHVK